MPVPTYRSTLTPVGAGVELAMPAKTNILVVAFFGAWLCGWAMGEWTVWNALLFPTSAFAESGSTGFLVVWLIGWTLGGLFVLLTILWNLFGVERFRVARDEVNLRREILGLGYTRGFDPRSVRGLRAVELPDRMFGFLAAGVPRQRSAGPLAFDYGAKTVRFGSGVDYAEASHWAGKIRSAVPSLNP
ncbi:MAG TPA: hypothetical protein VGC55_12665 [Dokdonella sp.]